MEFVLHYWPLIVFFLGGVWIQVNQYFKIIELEKSVKALQDERPQIIDKIELVGKELIDVKMELTRMVTIIEERLPIKRTNTQHPK